ncbi:MAG TPA: FAD-dependent oxidoreductase [Edaphobacter sp.]|jgi:glycine oxidase|nr:FAD-dependent oxidoreductase [Edaphobacter sp.]
MHRPDVCIAGAGIIGLSLALELHQQGLRVTVLDRTQPLAEASTAAAGMLAAADPHHPPELRALSQLSLSLYPRFLESLHALSGIRVPFQTYQTLQALPPNILKQTTLLPQELANLVPALSTTNHRFVLLDEPSIDPRQLAEALLSAVHGTTIDLRPETPVLKTCSQDNDAGGNIEVHTPGNMLTAKQFVDCTGAWASFSSPLSNVQIRPKKGQMLAVSLPSSLPLSLVIRTPEIYIVPRTSGPNTGRAIIGATIEDAGFDKTVHPADIDRLRSLAVALLPSLSGTTQLDAWAGLRPATEDGLPLLGALTGRPNHFIATGHYRDGILLAPATAQVMAQLLLGEIPAVDLTPFSPERPAIAKPDTKVAR